MNMLRRRITAAFLAFTLGSAFTAAAAWADVYMYQDKNGVLNFTNVPTHSGYQRVIRDVTRATGVGTNPAVYDGLILAASDRHNVDPDLIKAVIKVESDFNAAARSRKGAMGLMQLMPDTARLHNVLDAYDPNDNVEGGVRHLKLLLGRYQGDLQLSLAAYNAGSGAVDKHGGIPPYNETRDYVKRVLRFYDLFRGGSAAQ